MTNTPHTHPTPAASIGIDLLAEMRELEASWQTTVAGYTDAHGDIRPESYQDYDEAKADHGGEVADRLEDWIDRLAAALGAPLRQ